MLVLPSADDAGFRLKLLDLETCPTSHVCVGRMNDQVYAWSADGRLMQVVLLMGDRYKQTILTESSDGRPTLIAADELQENERMQPVHLRAVDVLSGIVRWRRKEKLIPRLTCHRHGVRSVVRVEAPQGAHIFDVESGARLRVQESELAPLRRIKQHKKVPSGPHAVALAAPSAELVPTYTLRRARAGTDHLRDADDDALEEARREFFFRTATAPTWMRSDRSDRNSGMREPTPRVWSLVQEVRALEDKPPITKIAPPSIEELDLPPDIKALFATQSAFLKTHWQIGVDLLPAHQKSAKERRAPSTVRVFGQEEAKTKTHTHAAHAVHAERARLLCAQPTSLGDRIGIYDGLGYLGPFPIETLLSETCWNLLEARDATGDASCAQMESALRRIVSE